MVGQAVGATAESPKDDRQDARRHQILFLFAITFENAYKKQKEHHRKISFQEEYEIFLKRHRVDYDEQFVWD